MMTNRTGRSSLSVIVIFFFCAFWALANNGFASSRGIRVIKDLDHQSGKIGTYRAFIIGIQDYNDERIPDLKTPIKDAQVMEELLRKHYGFVVETLLDRKATRSAIYGALRNLSAKAKPDDSVLIYYAGHGDLDRQFNDGWWIPADATAGDPATYLDNIQIQKAMSSMKARHVLLISDSCYSGTLFGQARAMPPVISDNYYLQLYNEKSRWGLTSGNKTPVSDSGTGGHSVFAYQLIKELQNNEKPFISIQELYTRIAPIISNNSDQTPLCRPVRNTGDQGGEFVFISSKGAVIGEPEKALLSIETNVNGAQVSIDGNRIGESPLDKFPLSPGKHMISVEKNGYSTYSKQIRVEAGRSLSLNVHLDGVKLLNARLFVDINPANAKVRLLNIGPDFYQGMELNAGRYQVEVSAVGYEKQVVWASLRAGEDKYLDISLQPVEVSRLEARNTASPTADGRWDWTVYIDADPVSLQRIKCVEYKLHKTFPNPVRTRCNPRDKFALSSNGWGTFQIKVKVMFDDGTEQLLLHDLVFR